MLLVASRWDMLALQTSTHQLLSTHWGLFASHVGLILTQS